MRADPELVQLVRSPSASAIRQRVDAERLRLEIAAGLAGPQLHHFKRPVEASHRLLISTQIIQCNTAGYDQL